ncbi:hypothetical protein HPP92_001772 [Vanilla planifolia]|uniref:Uncharacterized protein n=1 Tax=Vanilla planifolia TaxID=51239 RepID=A0A835VHV0_VANPL|nr:hypothetical protein HPP92_001772 [Vanilla planifolia]
MGRICVSRQRLQLLLHQSKKSVTNMESPPKTEVCSVLGARVSLFPESLALFCAFSLLFLHRLTDSHSVAAGPQDQFLHCGFWSLTKFRVYVGRSLRSEHRSCLLWSAILEKEGIGVCDDWISVRGRFGGLRN